jgi:ABC-type transporter MlaC component
MSILRHKLSAAALSLLILGIACCWQSTVLAVETNRTAEPSSAAQETVSHLVSLFINWNGDKLSQSFSNQAAQYIDYDLMSSMVLGDDNWAKLSAVQRRSFTASFRKLIEQRYYVRWHKIFKHGKFSYGGETNSAGQIVVKTEIAVKQQRTMVNWKLRQVQGSYKVVSLTTDHRDLIEILQPRFDKVLSQHGFNGLMSWINHRTASSSH